VTTVLVVDDAAVDREIAGKCIKEAGLTPIFAENGRIALEMILSQPPDIVLTDMQMPEMDGLELVKSVRAEMPSIPTILMTAWGSEEFAVTALKHGAASYVPKKNLKRDLMVALRSVLSAVETARERKRVIELFESSEVQYVLGHDPACRCALVSHLQDSLRQLEFCDEAEVIRVGTALAEAIDNAVDHGNLELDSALREESDNAYREEAKRRAEIEPYRDRRVHVTARLSRHEAIYLIRDQGSGFDVDSLPDPTDPENLLLCSGRGVLLIRTFMDEVAFNDKGNELTMIKRRVTQD
jgi:CheY-like chemotaxis protein/anti-sigma regulatory factor (Ser/Thr protein kinase)